jgi:hypothetical protein
MKLDRLLSRIRAALQDYASEFEQRALAAEYAEACARAAQRLEQIVPLIRSGQDYPALQVAEAPPPVLDVVRELSFAEAEPWRAFCRQRGLPTAQPFDEQHVDLVNQLYGKKISETHPLYREYRQTIRLRQEDQALRVLQSIRRVNPDDANAHAEYARLARRVLERRITELARALDQPDIPRALALMDAIEADDLPGREASPVWTRALQTREQEQLNAARARCLEIVPQLRDIRENGHWQDTLPLFAEWDMLRGQYEFSLPPDVEEIAASARVWAATRLANRERDEEHQRLWRELSHRLEQISREPANRPTRILKNEFMELQAQTAVLTTQASATDAAKPPLELLRRLDQETGLLRQNLRRRRTTQRVLLATGATGLVAALVFGLWWKVRIDHLADETARVQQLLQSGSADALAAALHDFARDFPAAAEENPSLTDLLQKARAFVQTHQEVRVGFDQQFTQLSQAVSPSLAPSQISALLDQVAQLDKQVGDLAPDQVDQAKSDLQKIRANLNQELVQTQATRGSTLAGIVARAGQLLDEKLTGTVPAETASATIADAQKILAEADQVPADAGPLSPQELTARAQLDDLAKKLATLATAASDAVATRGQLAQARTYDDYHKPFDALAANLLLNDPDVAAAHTLAALNPDWTGMAQHLLMPGDTDTWAFLQNLGGQRLQPATDAQSEDIAFSNLVSNDILGNTYRADLVEYTDGEAVKSTPVFLAGDAPPQENTFGDQNEEIHQDGQIINPSGTLTEKSTHWIQFNGQKARGEKFENIQLAPESQLCNRLKQAYDPRFGSIREPLLRVLDDVRGDAPASPILKAYLEQEIFKIMQGRPRSWGLTFSPSAQADAAQLTKITGGDLQPADWLFPSDPHLIDSLRTFFQDTAAHNYYDEADQNLEKLRQLRATPVRFAGYVDATGLVRLVPNPPATGSLWGLDADGHWRVLFNFAGGKAVPPSDAPTPARLTPLVGVPENSAAP